MRKVFVPLVGVWLGLMATVSVASTVGDMTTARSAPCDRCDIYEPAWIQMLGDVAQSCTELANNKLEPLASNRGLEFAQRFFAVSCATLPPV